MTTLIFDLAKVHDLHILQSRLSLDPESYEKYGIRLLMFKCIAKSQSDIGDLIEQINL